MQKMSKNLQHEFDALQSRLQVVQDPQYPMSLKRKLAELTNRIKTLSKEQKTLIIDRAKRERRLDKIIQQGQPEGMK